MHFNEHVAVGVFDRLSQADGAVEALVREGFPKSTISVICPQCGENELPGVEHVDPAGSRTTKSVAVGGAIGALLGGMTAVGGALATGGVGLAVAGPLMGGAAGWVAGGFIGAMMTRGFEPEIADYYDQALTRGQVLVAVDASEDDGSPSLERALGILAQAGAHPIELPRD